jgi:general secretion pathway protein E/type IV pilus assembly protein PilB
LWKPVGCRECKGTGYAGRRAIFELLRTDAEIGRMCINRASSADMRDYALKAGMMSLRLSGFQRVCDGTTTLEEVLRITRRDIVTV